MPENEKKQPRQKRSQQIVDAIVIAARKILSEQGAQALNTNYVAEVAGVNIASLYRWFPNKEAIIESAFEALVNEEISDLLTLLEQQDGVTEEAGQVTLETAVTFIIDPLIKRQQRFLALHDCFYKENQDAFNVGKRSFLGSDQTWIEVASSWLADVYHQHQPQMSHTECEFKAFMVTRSIQGLCLSAATDAPEYLDEAAFRQSMFDLAFNLLS
ncbi:MAG: TetR/AcrR family transcriptional regulator [Pseudomonadales bacterium]|nr:TetR/AcrR family transcriptional regulator [Pseudomonadales bacterium]